GRGQLDLVKAGALDGLVIFENLKIRLGQALNRLSGLVRNLNPNVNGCNRDFIMLFRSLRPGCGHKEKREKTKQRNSHDWICTINDSGSIILMRVAHSY